MEKQIDKELEGKVAVHILAETLRKMKKLVNHYTQVSMVSATKGLITNYEQFIPQLASNLYAMGYISEKQNQQAWGLVEKIWEKYRPNLKEEVA